MEFLQPPTWREALEARAAHPDALPIWGGTDVMVELNFARKRPAALLDLTRVDELSRWSAEDGWLRIGAGVSYTRVIAELGDRAAGAGDGVADGRLAADPQPGDDRGEPRVGLAGGRRAAAAVRGRRGGRARVGARRSRAVPIDEFVIGPKRNVLARRRADRRGRGCRRARGPQQFAKVGTRNAMVIAVCSFALDVGDGASARASARPGRRRSARPRSRGVRRGALDGSCRTTTALRGSASWSPRRPRRSTTCAGPPRTGGTRWACWRGAR